MQSPIKITLTAPTRVGLPNEEIVSIEQNMLSQCQPKKQLKLLASVSSISPILAVNITFKIDDAARFIRTDHFSISSNRF